MNEPTMETLTRRLDQVEKNEEVGCGLVAFLGHEMPRFAASCGSAFATMLLPKHPVPGVSRSTMAYSKFSVSCADRSSWVCSGGAWDGLRISRIAPSILAQF